MSKTIKEYIEEKVCPVCLKKVEGSGFEEQKVPEMEFGYDEEFIYRKCPFCGSWHLVDIPEDFSNYYHDEYYSLSLTPQLVWKQLNERYTFLKKLIMKAVLKGFSGVAELYANFGKWHGDMNYILALAKLRLLEKMFKKNYKSVLDVGCGTGRFVLLLKLLGFSGEILGIDPYLDQDWVEFGLFKKSLFELNRRFDVVVLNHSLEHFTESPEIVWSKLGEILDDWGALVIRIPCASTHQFYLYKEKTHLFQAPTHTIIYSIEGLLQIAFRNNMVLWDFYNEHSWNSLHSEAYLSGITQKEFSHIKADVKNLHVLKASGVMCFIFIKKNAFEYLRKEYLQKYGLGLKE